MPAATIVAAWIRADAGVGPSIASGSQSWNGNWADLPRMPMSSRTMARVRSPSPGAAQAPVSRQSAAVGAQWASTLGYAVEPGPEASTSTPRRNPTSAKRVTRNALSAARRALALRLQWPMSR